MNNNFLNFVKENNVCISIEYRDYFKGYVIKMIKDRLLNKQVVSRFITEADINELKDTEIIFMLAFEEMRKQLEGEKKGE